MTSRLRRKLDHMEDQGSHLNESFCLIGTPLPSLADTKKDTNEFVPVWKQQVTDDQGRRRFHGAFTGGFSAGYYNTVGSKEGWKPASFTSSRDNRAKRVQNVEDFMDEEDLAELRNSRRLEQTDTFKDADGFGTAAELGKRAGDQDPLSSALSSLIQPSTSSIGQQLLMKMGWKPGQGVGPRLTARKLRIQQRKISRRAAHVGHDPSAALDRNGMSTDVDDHDESDIKRTFAPRDTKLFVFTPKEDKAGLGYIKSAGMHLPGHQSGANADDDKANVSSGFGLGGHDVEEDDMDIYTPELGDLRSAAGRTLAYDRGSDEDEDGGVVLLGSSKIGQGRTARQEQSAQSDRSHKAPSASRGRLWHDGRPVIPGFIVDEHSVKTDQWFPMPDVPEGWRPRPARVWQSGKKKWDQAERDKDIVPHVTRDRVQMTADQRGEVLGETQLQGAQKSVFDYMSAKNREKLEQMSQATSSRSEHDVGVPATEQPRSTDHLDGLVVPPLSPKTASAALKGFIPFGDDLSQQARYLSYLTSQTIDARDQDKTPSLFPGGRIDLINKELADFSKSAQMFRPMSFAMSNRFTSSKLSAVDMIQPKPGLHVPDPTKMDEWKSQTRLEEEVKEILTPREEAARAGRFGLMTRSQENWAPHALLCKRFGVADPWPDGLPGQSEDGSKGPEGRSQAVGKTLGTKPLLGADVAWQNNFVHQSTENVPAPLDDKNKGAETDASLKERQPRTMAEVGMAEDENQGRDILTYQKPALDIFKAIFASDDEDDDDDDDSDKEDSSGPPPVVIRDPIPSTQAVTAPSPPRPAPPSNMPVAQDVVRPVFGLASSTSTTRAKPESEARSARKEKKRDRKKAKGMLSFDIGGEEEDDDNKQRSERSTKRRRKESHREARRPPEVEDDEWVEKPAA